MHHRLFVFRSATAVLVALALTLAACSDDDPVCPDLRLGAIEGYVIEAGSPYSDIEIHIGNFESHFFIWTRPDSTGHFRFDVANGLYEFTTTEPGSDYTSFSTSDTIRVNSNVAPLNFTFGRAEIRVDLPAELEGRRGLLTMRGPGSSSAWATVVDGRAAFTVHELESGSYTMQVSVGTLPRELETVLEVSTDSVATFAADLSGSYATLQGTVPGAWRTWDQSPPNVAVLSPDSLNIGRIIPDREGRFCVEVLTGLRFLLEIDDFDGLSFLAGGPTLAEATVFDLEPGDHLSGIDIPAAGIRVTLHGPGGMIRHQPSVRLIDPQGIRHTLFRNGDEEPLVIGGLAPGRYFLQVHGYNTGQTWAAQWYGGADSLAAATPIDVSAGEAVDLIMDLEPGGSISGQVLIGGATPLADIACALFDVEGRSLNDSECRNWQDFPTGSCTFTGLPDGCFYLAARLSGTPVWYPGTTDFDLAEPIRVDGHQAVTGLSWDVLPGKEVGP